jgi:hypothetical protein
VGVFGRGERAGCGGGEPPPPRLEDGVAETVHYYRLHRQRYW